MTGSPWRPKPRYRWDQLRLSLAAALPLRPTYTDDRASEKVPQPHQIGRPRETPLQSAVIQLAMADLERHWSTPLLWSTWSSTLGRGRYFLSTGRC